jgi:hypothetical protein
VYPLMNLCVGRILNEVLGFMHTKHKGRSTNIVERPLKFGAQEQNRTADTGIFSSVFLNFNSCVFSKP